MHDGENPPAADFTGCGLPDGAPAAVSRWRAPAAERTAALNSEFRTLDCPPGEVGAGIAQRRELTTSTDGFGNTVAAESSAGPWTEEGRDCRAPRTGSLVMPLECDVAGTSLEGKSSKIRLAEWDWTEERDPGDARQTRIAVDWGSQRIVLDMCLGAGSETVSVSEGTVTRRRSFSCAAEHGGIWNLGGPVEERRPDRVATVTYPPSWSRPPKTITRYGTWRVSSDDCRRETAQTRDETRLASCPAGHTGSVAELWRRAWRDRFYARPVPHRADGEVPGSASWAMVSADSSRCVPIALDNNDNNNNGGGGNNDNGGGGNNNNGGGCSAGCWVDPVDGTVYDHRPEGATGGTYCTDCDQEESSVTYDPHEDDGDGEDTDDDDGGGGNNDGGGGYE